MSYKYLIGILSGANVQITAFYNDYDEAVERLTLLKYSHPDRDYQIFQKL